MPKSVIEYHNESVFVSRTIFADSIFIPPVKPYQNPLSCRYHSQCGGVGILQESLSLLPSDAKRLWKIKYVGDKRLTFVEVPFTKNVSESNDILAKLSNLVSF